MAKLDLSKLSLEELQALARDIEQEIISRREADRERVLAQMRELAASLGMTLEDLLKQERGRERARVPATSVRFRHPENRPRLVRPRQAPAVDHRVAGLGADAGGSVGR